MRPIKKPILLTDLLKLGTVDKVIIESLEQALYRLEVEHQDQHYYVLEKPRKSLTRRSIVDMQSLLTSLSISAMFLRHTSPYDEMIGCDTVSGHNELLVPLGNFFDDMADTIKH